MSTENQKTDEKALAPKTETKLAKNQKLVDSFITNLEKNAVVATFHQTKGLRIGNSFAGKFVVNLCNNEAKVESTETNKVSAVEILDRIRNAKNYTDNEPKKVLASLLTERRLKFYASRFGKQAKAEFSAKDVVRCFIVVANKVFTAIK